MQHSSQPAGCLLETKRLTRNFGALRAVDQVSLKVMPGEIYGLLGPNGAGKTTILSIISGLLRPDTGEVLVQGSSFWANPTRAKQLMGVVPQEIALYEELSGRDNLEFWGRLAGLDKKSARTRARELLDALALADRAAEPVSKYSGGMKRRINIGCALLHRPKLLLLDEPTVGIDPQARASIIEFIRGLAKEGTGVLYTTHYLEEAETLCHRIGIIDHGRLLAEGSLEDLQAKIATDRLFLLEGDCAAAEPQSWAGFSDRFRVLQKSARQLSVAATTTRDPAEDLKELISLPLKLTNITYKKPSLNDVFLQLTGRELRD